MKITQQSEPKFIPVVITLETQEEVDILTSLIGAVTGNGDVRAVIQQLYDGLGNYACDVDERIDMYFSGTILAKYVKL